MEFIVCLNFLGIVEKLNNHLIVSLAKSEIFREWEILLGGEKKKVTGFSNVNQD